MNTSDVSSDSIRATMAELAANFSGPTDVPAILATVTAHAVELIDAVDIADVLVIDEHHHRSLAPTDDLAARLDTVQVDLNEGPCLDAAVHDTTVLSTDLYSETRWPKFAAAAVQAGVHSMMSFQLYCSPKVLPDVSGRAALNLFSRSRAEFSLEDQALGAMLATHAATALIAADRQAQFESALASRDLIGQAKGILMERYKVDAVRAFGMMTRISQDTNTKLRDIAQQIVDTP
ncbi:MAG: hypothetical protein K0R68_2288 [Mycobacterium sp.]|nr:hypothetical protein [Mycobacterium sp.]